MVETSGLNIGKYNKDQEFWNHGLPQKASSMILQRKKDELFDYLVVDEVQDMFIRDYLGFMDLCVKGGLAEGEWSFFGDFENQAIIKELDTEIKDLEEEANFVFFSLRKNCRNTPRIVSQLESFTNLSPHYNGTLRPDNGYDPDLLFYTSKEDQSEQLVHKLEELYGLGYKGNDITILSTHRKSPVPERQLDPKWRGRIKEYSNGESQYVQWTTIHSFKGLESPAIILTDIDRLSDEKAINLLYVGISRAQSNLTLLLSQDLRPTIKKILLSI
jgi:superfamily I DNA/RNA helicase